MGANCEIMCYNSAGRRATSSFSRITTIILGYRARAILFTWYSHFVFTTCASCTKAPNNYEADVLSVCHKSDLDSLLICSRELRLGNLLVQLEWVNWLVLLCREGSDWRGTQRKQIAGVGWNQGRGQSGARGVRPPDKSCPPPPFAWAVYKTFPKQEIFQ